MNLENLNVQEETDYNYASIMYIYPGNGVDCSIVTEEEKQVLNAVIEKFNSLKTKEIIDCMLEEKAYAETVQGEIIPFSLVNEIRAF